MWTDSQVYDHNSTIKVNGFLRPENSIAPILVVVTNPIGNVITIEQLVPDREGNFELELKTDSNLWKQNGEYVIKAQSGSESRQFKIKFSLVPSIIENNDCNADEIQILVDNGRLYCIPFKIPNGVVNLASGNLNTETKTLTLVIRGHEFDSITLDIPRFLLDSKSASDEDAQFTITANGMILEYQNIESDVDSREIKLSVSEGKTNTIEIVGTVVIPEFGSFTIVILVGSVLSVLIISRSISNKFVKF
jgi:predicted secreted protein with PEFG-CTERM motif